MLSVLRASTNRLVVQPFKLLTTSSRHFKVVAVWNLIIIDTMTASMEFDGTV